MKIKSFLATLLVAISSIVAFSSCNNDKEETDYYFFKLTAAITDPGDMSQSEIALVDQALDLLETTYNGNVFNQAMTVETANPYSIKWLMNSSRKAVLQVSR